MNQFGDAHDGQPGESVDSLSDIAALMDGDDAPEIEETLEEEADEAADDSEESDEQEAEESEDEADESTFTIKVNGKEVTVTQAEAIELAQKGLDYSQKTMAVAEERKAVEAERETVKQIRQQHEQALTRQVSELQAFASFMESQVGAPPSIELAQQDAAYYLAQKELYEARKGQLHQAREAIQSLQEEQARQRQAAIMEQAERTERELRDTLPGWNDDTLNSLADFGRKHGLDPGTVAEAFVQKGFWEVLHKARQYDELQARKATLKPKTELPKVAKPKASNQTPRGIVAQQEAFKRYREKPSIDSLANLL